MCMLRKGESMPKIMCKKWSNRLKAPETYTHTCNLLLSFKQIGTICFAILISIFSVSSFADNITTSPADCTQPTLSVDTGTANLTAEWQANTIGISWYNDGQKITGDANAATQCTYDHTFSLPTQPTKTGYTFTGWKVRIFDLSTLDTSIQGTGNGYKDTPSYSQSSGVSTYGLTEDLTWAVQFSYGRVYGEASCNSTTGTACSTTNWSTSTFTYTIYPENIKSSNTFEKSTNGGSCWCHATGFMVPGEAIQNVEPAPWVFQYNWSVNTCIHYCPLYCAKYIEKTSTFRQASYGIAQQ